MSGRLWMRLRSRAARLIQRFIAKSPHPPPAGGSLVYPLRYKKSRAGYGVALLLLSSNWFFRHEIAVER